MRHVRHVRFFAVILTVVLGYGFAAPAIAGFMLEFDYWSPGAGNEAQAVQGGWNWGDAHFYLLGDGPDLNQLSQTHSVRVSAWTSDSSGRATKHLGSIVGDLKDAPTNVFTNAVQRINVMGDTSTMSIFANVDFHEEAGFLKNFDEFAEGLFNKVTGMEGKGLLGWTVTKSIKGLLKLAGVDLFGSIDWDQYLPENNWNPNALAKSSFETSSFSVTTIPEPASLSLVTLGVLMIFRRPHQST
ncbi:hypothetical protein [Poriferisphaera sp. WC338]|uniref:hypothetical protein n=1 Tax=Poriferisphaera sp. WC338 TaxID=3425129 RepID=UPI003D8143EA